MTNNKSIRVGILLGFAAIISFSGCQIDSLVPNGIFQREQKITIEATYEQPEMETKTVRDDNAKIYWTPGDAISLFFGSGTNGGSKFIAQNDAVALKTAFSGSITAVTGGSDIDDEDTYFWGLYPYDATSSCDGSSVTMSIPSVQPGMEGTFAPGMAPSLGRSQKLVLSFRNIWSGFGFTVSEPGFQSVTFRGNAGENIAGKARIGIDENNLPKVLEILDGVQEVTLTAPEGGFVPGQYYYMQFFPCTFESGFSVELVSATKKGTYNYTKSMDYPRSTWKRAANVDTRVGEWEILYDSSVFKRVKASSGSVTNGVLLSYSGTVFNRIYSILPKPTSNIYQDITNFEAAGCTDAVCADGINNYVWKDIQNSSNIPSSGQFVISESFDATVYEVEVDFSQIENIPEYDPESEECQKYLGAEEGGLVDPTNSIIVSTANSIWQQAGGDIIDYARMCHSWTHANMIYGNMNTGLHPISELMETMTGDCGNYASVFISLLRAKGIPARHLVMVDGKLSEYHVRAEFFIPSYGWIPADPTWGDDYFGVFSGDFIVMTQGINTIVRDYAGNDFRASLLQTFCYWYWYQTQGNNITFTHICTGLN